MSTDLAVRPVRAVESVNDDSLQKLFKWVTETATVADLVFDNVRFREVRDWLTAHKAARDLRVKAIRIECIALRKVGIAGLADRLTRPTDRRVAQWLATVSDEQFKSILEESDIATTPFAVMKWITDQESAVKRWGNDRDQQFQYDEANRSSPVYNFGLTHEVQNVLEEIIHDQEDFTVAEAAERLWDKLAESAGDRFSDPGDLNDEHNAIPPELAGEPLREVVRRVLRAPGAADKVLIGDSWVAVPNWVTFQPDGGEHWKRAPWDRAELWQLKMMVELRQAQARMAERVAENISGLYERLEAAQIHSETTRCADLIAYAGLEAEVSAPKKMPGAVTPGQNTR